MSYVIKVTINPGGPGTTFKVVDSAVFHYANGGTWKKEGRSWTLTMGGSGTSGILIFQDFVGSEIVGVVTGVHNYKRWCDIATDLKYEDTAAATLATYYGDTPRSALKWKQLDHMSVTLASGREVSIDFTVKEGKNLEAGLTLPRSTL